MERIWEQHLAIQKQRKKEFIMKKNIAMLILVALLTSSLLSCGNGTEEVAETTDNTAQTETVQETETELMDSLPEGMDLQGESVNFFSDNYGGVYSTIFVEEETGEILNDAKYHLKLAVEERLNVSLTETLGADVWASDNQIKQLVTAGDTTYDIMTNMDRFIIANVQNGLFYATSDMPYVDLQAVYWNPTATNLFQIGEKTYMTMSSFNLYGIKNTAMVLMDMDMAKDLGMPNMYKTVLDGKWTYDMMASLAEKAYVDANGDGQADVDDTFGLLLGNKASPMMAIVGCGSYEEVISHDEASNFTYNVTEHFINVLQKSYDLFQVKTYIQSTEKFPFVAGQALFVEASLAFLDNVREAEQEFLVLPMPKYDEAQATYYCRTYDSYFSMVPVTCQKLDAVGAVLEALACEGYKNLIPAYVETTLQKKYADNQETSALIQMCVKNRTIFLAEAFMFDLWGDVAVHAYVTGTNASPASFIAKQESKTVKEIEKINKTFQDIGN